MRSVTSPVSTRDNSKRGKSSPAMSSILRQDHLVSSALVTGGASGIGAATVARLRRDGMKVAAVDLDAARLEQVDADFRAEADVTSEEEIGRAVGESAAALAGLAVVVACAGVAGGGTVPETSLEEWGRI